MRNIIVSFIIFLFLGCAYNTGVTQRAEKSYLKFIGDYDNVTVKIDDNNPFLLNTDKVMKGDLFQLAHGKHSIEVYRNNSLIMERIIFLEDHGTMEILIPWKID